jgi:hypothetical protein
MPNNIFSSIATLLNRFVDVISNGNLERVRILQQFNLVFREAYLSGEIERHCTVTTAAGRPEYRHQLSTFYLRSGFKITIENDRNLGVEDFEEIARYVIQSAPFVRQLMYLGYDTLIIKGVNYTRGIEIALKEIADWQNRTLGM